MDTQVIDTVGLSYGDIVRAMQAGGTLPQSERADVVRWYRSLRDEDQQYYYVGMARGGLLGRGGR